MWYLSNSVLLNTFVCERCCKSILNFFEVEKWFFITIICSMNVNKYIQNVLFQSLKCTFIMVYICLKIKWTFGYK